MTLGQRAEAFLGLLVAILCFTAVREDNPTVKIISIVVSVAGLVGVVLLRRHLARVWIEIYAITFAGIALILIVNMLFLSQE